jgi:glutamyl/glutaminyl-tRNA synthetase
MINNNEHFHYRILLLDTDQVRADEVEKAVYSFYDPKNFRENAAEKPVENSAENSVENSAENSAENSIKKFAENSIKNLAENTSENCNYKSPVVLESSKLFKVLSSSQLDTMPEAAAFNCAFLNTDFPDLSEIALRLDRQNPLCFQIYYGDTLPDINSLLRSRPIAVTKVFSDSH